MQTVSSHEADADVVDTPDVGDEVLEDVDDDCEVAEVGVGVFVLVVAATLVVISVVWTVQSPSDSTSREVSPGEQYLANSRKHSLSYVFPSEPHTKS